MVKKWSVVPEVSYIHGSPWWSQTSQTPCVIVSFSDNHSWISMLGWLILVVNLIDLQSTEEITEAYA